jgi:hypothetical protein
VRGWVLAAAVCSELSPVICCCGFLPSWHYELHHPLRHSEVGKETAKCRTA